MSILPMYVVSNGELARECLNAVVTLFGTDSFAAAIKISVLFSILSAAINYIYKQDVMVFAKWFVIYFGITAIMLNPNTKVTLQIFDSSNPGRADLTVANVPYGLGYPASLITTASQGLVTAFEDAFHLPDDFAYNKTGMLFGSKLFRLSTEFNIVNPKIRTELNEYIKNCVLGDILINKKYSISNLVDSKDLLNTITENTSNIRGIYIDGTFKTCSLAKTDIKKHIEDDIKGNLFKIIGKKIFSRFSEKKATNQLESSLGAIYNHFNYGGLSNSALQIATQNILINGVREGILNYTSETEATAALLLNFSSSQAMDKMRMTLATSRNIATYAIPIMHTVLLLLMLGLFPLMIFLAFQPNLTAQVLKNYFYTLLWIESWPLMFACLNLIVNFYTKSETGGAGLTISNIDQLALEHSDIANMAGYLMLSIPFISGGLVKGMSSAFNHAASYIGGVLQSSASSAASEAASGNIHLGNSSWNNVNANKFDTNSTLMHGMATEQLGTGVLKTSRPDGKPIYDASHAISKLPTNVRTSDLLNSALTEQAETSQTASIQDLKTHDQSTSHAVSDFSSLGKTLGSNKAIGENFTERETMSTSEHFADMHNIAKNIAERNHLDVNDVFRGLVNFSQQAELGLGISASSKLPTFKVKGADVGIGGDIGLRGKLSTEHSRIQESSTQHGVGRSIDISAEEAQRFSKDLHKVEEYSKTSHADTSHSTAASQLSQLSTDLRSSRNSLEQYSVHKADAERASRAASYVRQHSSQVDSDLGQEVADYAVSRVGREEAEQLFAGKNRPKLEAISKEYISYSGIGDSIISKYQQDSAGIHPEQKYRTGAAGVDAKASGITLDHEQHKQKMDADAKAEKLGVDEQEFGQFKKRVDDNRTELDKNINDKKSRQNSDYNNIKDEVTENIKEGEERSKSSAYSIGNSIKPNFANQDKKKK
jgi:conjugal transfer mating pair stabilization protein TraG